MSVLMGSSAWLEIVGLSDKPFQQPLHWTPQIISRWKNKALEFKPLFCSLWRTINSTSCINEPLMAVPQGGCSLWWSRFALGDSIKGLCCVLNWAWVFSVLSYLQHGFFSPQKTIESETVKTSEVIKKKLGEITGTVKEVKGSCARSRSPCSAPLLLSPSV